jgi:hypothetical protein
LSDVPQAGHRGFISFIFIFIAKFHKCIAEFPEIISIGAFPRRTNHFELQLQRAAIHVLLEETNYVWRNNREQNINTACIRCHVRLQR